MMMKDKIVEILMREFRYISCFNCRGDEDDRFGDCVCCDRRNVEWSLSEKSAERVADRIINTIFQIKEKDISKE